MKEFKEFLVNEVNEIFDQIVKEVDEDVSGTISDILIKEGFVQHKMVDIYKKKGITQDVSIMRLNKAIGILYNENSLRIDKIKIREKEEGIPDRPMNIWLSELIEEDLYNGRAPFKNTKKNIKILHDFALNYDPLFNAIEFELEEMYNHVAKEKLIEPISFVDSVVEQERPKDKPKEVKPKELINTKFEDSVEVEVEEEYVSSPFGSIVDSDTIE